MKRKHHEIAGPSDNLDHPNKRARTWVFPRLPTELVRRISEFVVQLTHARFVGVFPMLLQYNLVYPRVYNIQVTDNAPFAHLPPVYRPLRVLRFTRFEIANGQHYVWFQTLQDVGYWLIRIPIQIIHSLTENLD